MSNFRVWDPLNSEESFASEHEADEAEDAACSYLESYDASDGYPDTLFVRAPDGRLHTVSVAVDYEPVFHARADDFCGPVQQHFPRWGR